MRNVINSKVAFAVLLSVLSGCGIKYATNKVLSNPDAIAKVGAVYDALTPRDTTERLVFIQGDSIVVETSDTVYINPINNFVDAVYRGPSLKFYPDTVRITTTKHIRSIDTIKWRLPPDNRAINRLNESAKHYKTIADRLTGKEDNYKQQIKSLYKWLISLSGAILVLGVVIGLLFRFKIWK